MGVCGGERPSAAGLSLELRLVAENPELVKAHLADRCASEDTVASVDALVALSAERNGLIRAGDEARAVRKKLSEQAREAQVSAQKAADDAVRAAGGETKRDKLERLFASDAEEVPTDENLSEFERFLENRRKGGTDADFYAAKEAKQPKADDDDWMSEIKYKPPK